MRRRNAHPSLFLSSLLVAGAIAVACNRDAPDPLGPQALAHQVVGTVSQPAPERSATPAADIASVARLSRPRLKVPVNARRTDGVPEPGDIWALDMNINGSEKVLEFRLDQSGQYVDKASFYDANGQRYYGATLQWAVDANGPYVSSISQTSYASNDQSGGGDSLVYNRNTGWTETGRWEPMQIPLSARLYSAIKISVYAHLSRRSPLPIAMQGSTNCTPSNVQALATWAVQTYDVASGNSSNAPPPPPANLPAGISCAIEGVKAAIEYQWDNVWKPVAEMGLSITVDAVVRSEKIWDRLRRPWTTNATTPIGGTGDVWLKTAGDCNATIGYACNSLTAYMQM